jgi:hypothetical protein
LHAELKRQSIRTMSGQQLASMKLINGGDDEEEDEKDGAKDKEEGAERLWDSVMVG